MYEAHFGVPMCGAVLNALNTRLDAQAIAFMLEHGEAKLLITDTEFSAVIDKVKPSVPVIDVEDAEFEGGTRLGDMDYEAFLATGDPEFEWRWPEDEWEAIALNYTSGTTGNPKGFVYHHRGAYLNAVCNIVTWSMPHLMEDGLAVMDPQTMQPLPADGETMGEIMFRGNITMKGYLKNAEATRQAFSGGLFHSGDLAVTQPDGYVKIKDRSKDIIVSGGENISSLEVEDVLYRHPAVLAAAVVAMPDEKWGETPCAFVETRPDAQLTDKEIIEFCRRHLASFKAPRAVVFGELPKTSTGKIQKFVLRGKAKSATAIQT